MTVNGLHISCHHIHLVLPMLICPCLIGKDRRIRLPFTVYFSEVKGAPCEDSFAF